MIESTRNSGDPRLRALRRSSLAAIALISICSVLAGCRQPPPIAADASVPKTAATATRTGTSARTSSTGDAVTDARVKPVYPTNVPLSPVAIKLCTALHGVPVARRAACCKAKPGVVLVSECARNLSAALESKAITLADKDVDACSTAVDQAFTGCDWLGPHNEPPPAVCFGIIHGTLDAKAQCRSSLECKDGLRCIGVGPTDPGVCGEPFSVGKLCNASVDPLAVYARQDDYEVRHPACANGWCDRNRCETIRAKGTACKSNPECGPGARCQKGKCEPGAFAKKGGACLGGDCPGDLRCILGKCAETKPVGATCTFDAECKAACVSGKCEMGCSQFPQLPPGRLKRLFPGHSPLGH